jgi:hypothetical protein
LAKAKPDGDEDILERARERFAYAMKIDDDNRKRQSEATRFVYEPGAQYTKDARTKREKWGDPCMEFPQLKQFVNQVVNDQRLNRPGVRVHPAGGEASEEVAELLQGLVRGIEYESRAEAIYDNAYQHSVVGGRGYWRLYAEYESDDSFNQRLRMAWIPDPLTCVMDPDYKEPDGSDRNWGFVFDTIRRDEFARKYPKASPIDFTADVKLWYPDGEHVIIADYYERVAIPRDLAMLSDGTVAWADEIPKMLPAGIEVMRTRKSNDYRVDWYTIGGGQTILERHEWPGTIVPIVCTTGDEIVVEGRRIYAGLVEQAMDSQRLFNFGMTQQAIHLGLTPRAPYLAEVGQTEGLEQIWNKANEMNLSVLPYKAKSIDGNMVPMPQRQMASTPDAGWITWSQQMTALMRSTIGMYENSLGMRSQEVSGRAILAREKQGDTSTFHFQDNLSRAIALTGRIILDALPHYYDTERILYIVQPDGERKEVTINQYDPTGALDAIARKDVTVGKYAVTSEAGPSYATKRQETAETINQIVQAYPMLMQVAGDLVMKAQEVPDAELFAERLRLTLPPAIQQAIQQQSERDGDQKPLPPEVQAHLAQAAQAMEQMQQQLQQFAAENQALKAGQAADLQKQQMADKSKELVAAMNNATELLKESMRGASAEGAAAAPAVSPDQQMAAIVALSEQVMQMGQQMTQAVSMPRQMTLQVDENGDPVGAITTVVGGDDMPMHQGMQPDQMGMLTGVVDQVLGLGRQLADAINAPRQIVLQTGADGVPVGAISAPVGLQ